MPPTPAPPTPPITADLDRRSFLRRSAGGGAAIALVSTLPSGCAADYPQASADGVTLRALSPKEYAAARAAAETLLAGVPVEAASVAAELDRELDRVGDPVREDMKTVLALLEHLTFLAGHLRRFSALDVPERDAYLRGWAHSRFGLRRAAYMATQAFIRYIAFARDETRPLTGFLGPWPERVEIPAYPVDFGEVA